MSSRYALPYILLLLLSSRASVGQQAALAIGIGDELAIAVVDMPEIGATRYRIDSHGEISLPVVGRIHAAGLSPGELEREVVERLAKYLRKPQVSVMVTELRSQPVSVLGAVGRPGVVQVDGSQTLYEVFALAGGLRPDAGNVIRIVRLKEWGPLPIEGAKFDETGSYSVAEVNVRSITEGQRPEHNIRVMPRDVISVPKAALIYVVGSVRKPGGYPLNEREPISALQALSLAEGLDRGAAPKNARILRLQAGNPTRAEIRVDLRKILAGSAADLTLEPDDIVFVPSSAAKNAGLRTLETAIQMATGVVIYRR